MLPCRFSATAMAPGSNVGGWAIVSSSLSTTYSLLLYASNWLSRQGFHPVMSTFSISFTASSSSSRCSEAGTSVAASVAASSCSPSGGSLCYALLCHTSSIIVPLSPPLILGHRSNCVSLTSCWFDGWSYLPISFSNFGKNPKSYYLNRKMGLLLILEFCIKNLVLFFQHLEYFGQSWLNAFLED